MTKTAAATAWTSTSSTPAIPPMLLLVDDDRSMRVLLQEVFEQHGYQVVPAENGEECMKLLAAHATRIDTVVLDREMPILGGMEVVRRMRKDPQLASIPIIMLTGMDSPDKIQEGIDAGVHYYLAKSATNAVLKSIVDSALRERNQKRALIAELSRHGAALQSLNSCQITIKTLKEAEDTACLLASCFPNPERVVAGLMELLVNAVEHGNLGITYEEKRKLLAENRWREEIDRRAKAAEHAHKKANVIFQRKQDGCLVQITDSGEGFDWKRYWHINPTRATASNGRGITRARLMAFDRMAYNEKGNSVTIMVSESPPTSSDYAW